MRDCLGKQIIGLDFMKIFSKIYVLLAFYVEKNEKERKIEPIERALVIKLQLGSIPTHSQ